MNTTEDEVSFETTKEGQQICVPNVRLFTLFDDLHAVALKSIEGVSAVFRKLPNERYGECVGFIVQK